MLPLQRVKTIRIAESSDMDSWEALLDHVQKVLLKGASLVKEEMLMPNYTKWSDMSCGGKRDHDELWSGKRRSFG